MRDTLVWSDDRAEVHQAVVGQMDNNVYVIRCRATGEALLVDAANDADRLVELARELGVTKVVETHGHWDHIQAVAAMQAAGFPVGIAAGDAGSLPEHDFVIEPDQVIQVGELSVRAIATPGHTPGSTCFELVGAPILVSGDTLFPGGPGNTSFPGGDFAAIIRSIEEALFAAFTDDTMVLPGHGSATTIGAERPNLPEWKARGW